MEKIEKNKKAQVPAQMFTYILTLLIIGLMLYFGVGWLGDLISHADEIEEVQFKNQLENTFEEMKGDYGTMREESFRTPGDIQRVCFLDSDKGDDADSIAQLPDDICDDYPMICDTWLDEGQNIAFYPDDEFDLYIDFADIEVDDGDDFCEDYCVCRNVTDGRFSVTLIGRGDTVEVTD